MSVAIVFTEIHCDNRAGEKNEKEKGGATSEMMPVWTNGVVRLCEAMVAVILNKICEVIEILR